MTRWGLRFQTLVLAGAAAVVLGLCFPWTVLQPGGGGRQAGESQAGASVPQCQPLAAGEAQEPGTGVTTQLDADNVRASKAATPSVPPVAAAEHANGSSLPAFKLPVALDDAAWERWKHNPVGRERQHWPVYCESATSCRMHERLTRAAYDQTGEGLCIFTIVDQNPRYMSFVPLYVYFALAAYPAARVVIVNDQGFPEDVVAAVQAALRELRLTNSSAVLLTDPSATLKVARVGKSSLVAALRFLYDDPTGALDGCDFVYTGDVDILIDREPVSLLAYHTLRMLATGQPYDNIRRNISPKAACRGFDGERLSGLHMVLYEPYRQRTAAARKLLLEMMERGDVAHWCCTKGDFCDEHLLFQLVWRSGLHPGYVTPIGAYQALEAIRPFHGYHYSALRHGTQSATVSESRRQYLCPHLSIASRLLPKQKAHPLAMLNILKSANCNSSASAS